MKFKKGINLTKSKVMTSTDDLLRQLIEENKKLQERLDRIEESCSRMDDHIGFIQGVYNYVRTKVSRLIGGKELPQITQHEEDSPHFEQRYQD